VNCCSVLLLQPAQQRVLMARGAVAADVAAGGGNAAGSLQAVARGLAGLSSGGGSSVAGVLSGAQQQLWLADRAALQQAGVAGCSAVPSGAQSALLQAVPGGYALLVLGERPR
jgi:hypothetical protein